MALDPGAIPENDNYHWRNPELPPHVADGDS
jgi:hypothetical protein